MGRRKWGLRRRKREETVPGLPECRASLPVQLPATGAQLSGEGAGRGVPEHRGSLPVQFLATGAQLPGEGGGPTGREQACYFVAGLPIQAGGGHVAGPVRTAAGQEDQVTGEGLVLLDHDDVPNLQDRRQTAL